MANFEKVADYKRAAKNFLRGIIKAGVFVDEKSVLNLYVSKDGEEKTVTLAACNGTYCAKFAAEASTRLFNKFDTDFVEDLTKIFAARKNLSGINVAEKC